MSEHQHGYLTTQRIEFFSDAVFAVAITLLALSLTIEGHLSHSELIRKLISMRPQFVSYGISFIIIGIYWMEHLKIYHFIKRADQWLLTLNLLFLISITLVPFLTSLVDLYRNSQETTIIYASSLTVTGLLAWAMWRHASRRHRLIDEDTAPYTIRLITLDTLLLPLVFLISIGISFINLTAAHWSWLLVIFVKPVVRGLSSRVGERRRGEG